jgi:hypothetical protein
MPNSKVLSAPNRSERTPPRKEKTAMDAQRDYRNNQAKLAHPDVE